MAKKPRFYLPSGGGLVRYTDEYRSKIEISPQGVIVIIITVLIIELLLHFFM